MRYIGLVLKIWGVLCLIFAAFYMGLTLYAAATPSTIFTPGPTGLGEWIGMGLISLGLARVIGLLEKNGEAQALKQFFQEKLPAEYVNSPKYTVSVTQEAGGYKARITLDMTTDGSTYDGFGKDNFAELADLESDRVFDMLSGPPVPVAVTFDMDFGGENKVTMEKGYLT